MKKRILVVGSITLIVYVLVSLYLLKKEVTSLKENSTKSGAISSVMFECADSKKIHAVFFEDKVELTLSDKRSRLLSHAMSASGARYTNSEESFIFWNKGSTAFVEEGNKMTFKDCVEAAQEGGR